MHAECTLYEKANKDACIREGGMSMAFPSLRRIVVAISASLLTTTLTYFLFTVSRYVTTKGTIRCNAPIVDRSLTEVSLRGPSFP